MSYLLTQEKQSRKDDKTLSLRKDTFMNNFAVSLRLGVPFGHRSLRAIYFISGLQSNKLHKQLFHLLYL